MNSTPIIYLSPSKIKCMLTGVDHTLKVRAICAPAILSCALGWRQRSYGVLKINAVVKKNCLIDFRSVNVETGLTGSGRRTVSLVRLDCTAGSTSETFEILPREELSVAYSVDVDVRKDPHPIASHPARYPV